MEPARCCLADCYFQSCYLSLARICLEKLARQSHFAALINIVHYVHAGGELVGVGSGWGWWVVLISWGAPWIRGIWVVDYMCSSFHSPSPTHPFSSAISFAPKSISPSSPCSWNAGKTVAVQLQAGRLFIAFLFASASPCLLVSLNANGSWRGEVGRRGGLGFADLQV